MVLNIILLIIAYIIPLYVLYLYQNDWRNIYTIQNIVFVILFVGSALIIYLNNQYRKQFQIHKWFWVISEIIGIVVLLGSGFVLFLIFSLRNGIGF